MMSAPVKVCSSKPFTVKGRFVAGKERCSCIMSGTLQGYSPLHQVLLSREGVGPSLGIDQPLRAYWPSSDTPGAFPQCHCSLAHLDAAATIWHWVGRVFRWRYIHLVVTESSFFDKDFDKLRPQTTSHIFNFDGCTRNLICVQRQQLKCTCVIVARNDTQIEHFLGFFVTVRCSLVCLKMTTGISLTTCFVVVVALKKASVDCESRSPPIYHV